jgi:uncharacterized protein (TIGR02145 family)
MKKKTFIFSALLAGLLAAFLVSCKKESPKAEPIVTTNPVTESTSTSVICGGEITFNGSDGVITRGVCWSTRQLPLITDNRTMDGTGIGSFTSTIAGLSPGTTYYIRAYATGSLGTMYGNQVTAYTSNDLPVVTVKRAYIVAATATFEGEVISDGGASVTALGVCWSLQPNPTVANNKTSEAASGTGSFESVISGLAPNTTYYVRSYAVNSVGINYGSELKFTAGLTVTDPDGNIYRTVTIGTQTWMAENLKTTKLNDGTPIPNVTDNNVWMNYGAPACCWYNNNVTVKDTYGALYNWYAVNTGKLCPAGWHVPTDAEWTALIDYLGGESIAGEKLKETGITHWHYPNSGITNESGFTAVPGGYRWSRNQVYATGLFYDFGIACYFWTATLSIERNGIWYRWMSYDSRQCQRDLRDISTYSAGKGYGYSVRCVKDN